jgi:hypothetical protein
MRSGNVQILLFAAAGRPHKGDAGDGNFGTHHQLASKKKMAQPFA